MNRAEDSIPPQAKTASDKKWGDWKTSGGTAGGSNLKSGKRPNFTHPPKKENEFNEKLLVDSMKKFNEEFNIRGECQDVWKIDSIWYLVAEDMSTKSRKYSHEDAKKEFRRLLIRYDRLLMKKECEKARSWPYFSSFYSMELDKFDIKGIKGHKEDFEVAERNRFMGDIDKELVEEREGRKVTEPCDANPGPSSTIINGVNPNKKEVVTDYNLIDTDSSMKTFRHKFYIPDYEAKQQLVKAMLRFSGEFDKTFGHADLFVEAPRAWSAVSQYLKTERGVDYSVLHCQTYFRALCGQYTHILKFLKSWSLEHAGEIWPCFTVFFNKMRIGRFIQECPLLETQYSNYPKFKADSYFSLTEYKGKIPMPFFKLTFIDSKISIAESVKKYQTEFVALSKTENVWDSEQIWKYVKILITEKYGENKIKAVFLHLLDQYRIILQDLSGMRLNEAQKFWNLFNTFHYDWNLTPFRRDINQLRNHFNKGKIKHKPKTEINELDIKSNEEPQKYIELLSAVYKYLPAFKNMQLTDSDIWQKVASELSEYEPDPPEVSWKTWQDQFKALLQKYLIRTNDDSISSEDQRKWALHTLFEHLNLDPFLDRIATPIVSGNGNMDQFEKEMNAKKLKTDEEF